jgi:uncharacterized protein
MTFDDTPPLPEQRGTDSIESGRPTGTASSTEPASSDALTASASTAAIPDSSRNQFDRSVKANLAEDLRVPWGWVDLAFLVLAGFAGIILLMVLFVIGYAALGGSIEHLQRSASTQDFFGVIVQAVLDVALLGYLAMHLRIRFHVPFWRTIGWQPLETGKTPPVIAYFALVLCGFFLAVVVTLASAMAPPKSELPIQQLLQDRSTAILFALLSVAIAPVFEETVFRGFLYPVVARSFGVTAGVLVTGTIFGLLHAAQLMGGWWQIALLVAVGIVFTLARALTRTVASSFVLHISYNSLQVIALVIGTHGFRHMQALR